MNEHDEFSFGTPLSQLSLFDEDATPDNQTLADAVSHLKANLDDGLHCPCCGQYARRYKRSLYRTCPRGGWQRPPPDQVVGASMHSFQP